MATTLSPATGETTKPLVNYRTDRGVAVIEMFDPPANTYTYEMNRQLDEAILKARMDNDVYVIVLTGSGDKFFSAGANIKMLSSVDPTFKYYFCLHANEMLLRLEHTPKLVIAAINGHCVGGGLEIAMAADIRIARQDAGKIGLPEVNLGVLPGTGGTQRLSRMVGKSKAIELMVTGNTFSFEEAKEIRHRQRHLRSRRLHGQRHGVRPAVLPAEQGVESGRTHQAGGADRLGDSHGVGAGGGTREPAVAVPERGRQGRSGGVRGEAAGSVQGEVGRSSMEDGRLARPTGAKQLAEAIVRWYSVRRVTTLYRKRAAEANSCLRRPHCGGKCKEPRTREKKGARDRRQERSALQEPARRQGSLASC